MIDTNIPKTLVVNRIAEWVALEVMSWRFPADQIVPRSRQFDLHKHMRQQQHFGSSHSHLSIPRNMSSAPPRPLKRRRTGDSHTQHALHNIQHVPAHTEPAAQDATFIRAQVNRSISTALIIVGYDGAAPEALEAFRAETEECNRLLPTSSACAILTLSQTYSTSCATSLSP